MFLFKLHPALAKATRPSPRLLALGAALCLLATYPCSAQANAQTSASPSSTPPKTWVDPDTGHRIVRLSDEPGSASTYFNVNSYTPDGKEMVFTTPNGISAMDLKTFKSRPVVQGRVRLIVAGRRTNSVFYIKPEEHALYTTNIDTGETMKLADLPARAGVDTVNSDETLAAGTYIEGSGRDYNGNRPPPGDRSQQRPQNSPLDQPRNKGQMMEQRLAARLPIVLFTIDLRTGKINILLHSTDWINHLLFSPADPTLLMYCHEGPWQKVDRIWTIHTDGTGNTLIHQRTMVMEIAGHEFWGHDGKTIWYDLQTPKGEDFWLASYNLETGHRTWYHMQRNEWSIHFNVSADASLFCGDGGDPGQVAKAPDGEWLELFHPQLIRNNSGEITKGPDGKDLIQAGVFHSEHLVNMSKHNYHLEPNVSFTPDQKWIVFRSNMFGPTYVFAVEVAKANSPEADHTKAN